jgi:hypothetical protein
MGKRIFARLVDINGDTITERARDTKKEAKEQCEWLLSDTFATDHAGTTHEAMGTDHAELWVNDSHEQDFYKK